MEGQEAGSRYRRPPVMRNSKGEIRTVGIEVEFSGLKLEAVADILAATFDGKVTSRNKAEIRIETEDLGNFSVQLDWGYLKDKAAEEKPGREDLIEWMRDAAAVVVPVEVVCPPVPMDRIEILDPLIDRLREAGALGTQESLLAAYGVHVNPEVPELDARNVFAYLRAFALLQWWLVDTYKVDTSREISPFIALYSEAFVKEVAALANPGMDQLFDLYLQHNASRNRAMDLLPILSMIDEERVRTALKGTPVSSRPTFHYRLPDCHIQSRSWSLADAWNPWCIIEACASRPEEVAALAAEFLEADRILIGVNRKNWVERTGHWLEDRQLV